VRPTVAPGNISVEESLSVFSLLPLEPTVPLATIFFTLLASNPHSFNLELVIPLALSSLAIMITLPISAARSRLHIPGWVGLALFSFVLSYTCARISGVHGIVGHRTGVLLAIMCFLFLAAALGSVIALFFYKDPPGV
jgi:hypothetical protein